MSKRSFLIVLFVLLAGQTALAANMTYFDWFKVAAGHLRTANSYLRTHNNDFAALELEALIEKNAAKVSPEKMQKIVDETIATTKNALAKIDDGQAEKARQTLAGLRERLYQANKANGRNTFEDCIWILVKKGKPLWHYKKNPPDFAKPAEVQKMAEVTRNYLDQLEQCDAMADAKTKADPTYKRLVEGARRSLERIPTEALANKDKGQLYRFIIELRSFDRLLFFRFG